MVLVVASVLMVTVAVLGARHHRARARWVSPYATFRTAGAKVTRTTESAFDVAGVRLTQPG